MNVLQDIRFALRIAAKSPGFSAVVVLTLALGIGANTTVFTLVNAVLFRGMPFEKPDEIVALIGMNFTNRQPQTGISYPDFVDLKAQNKSFRDVSPYAGIGVNISNEGNVPERFSGARVGTNLFSLIGVKPVVGRDFAADDGKPGANPTAIISNSVWKNRYGSSSSVIGRVVRINEVPTAIVGVMPADMQFPNNQEMWIAIIPKGEGEKRETREFSLVARTKDGVTIPAARAEMDLIAKNLEKAYPASNKSYNFRVQTMNEQLNGGPIRTIFLALLGAVGFVLLIACCNVANLLLSRSVSRAREVSIRTALGASRWRVVRQMLIECFLYSLTGAVLGLALAYWGIRVFDAAVADSGKPYWMKFTMDGAVFFYVSAICLGSSFLFGLFPALHTTKVDLNAVLKEGGRGNSGRTRWFSEALVIGELSLAVILLIGAGLMVRSFMKLYQIESIDHPENVLQMRLSLATAKYPKPEQRQQFFERLLAKLRAVPGAEAVALSSDAPLEGASGYRFEVEGAPPVENEEKRPSVSGLTVTPGYFETVAVPILRGRDFTDSDGTQGKNSAIVTQGFAVKYFPNTDPLGRRFRLSRSKADEPWLTVVGIAKDFRQTNFDRTAIDPLIFLPYRQETPRGMSVLARGRNASALAQPFRKEISEIDADLPADQVMTSAARMLRQQWPFRVFGSMFAIFASIALAMASIGLYAVISYGVGRRTQEIGVRMALGASAGSVAGMILKNGGRQIAIGLALGLAGAFGVTRALSAVLVQITPTDPVTFGSVTGLLAAVSLLACWIPARRAMRVDPLVALRYE